MMQEGSYLASLRYNIRTSWMKINIYISFVQKYAIIIRHFKYTIKSKTLYAHSKKVVTVNFGFDC